jgi:excinuclease ABC subunit A
VIDIGPKAGKYGGEIISKGTPAETWTPYHYMYMNGEMKIEVPAKRREGNGKFLN